MASVPWRNKQKESGGEETSTLAALRAEMDRLFDAYVREPFQGLEWPLGEKKWSPAVDVAEDEQEVTVRAEVPGMDPEDLDATVSGNQLVLSGVKREWMERKGKDFSQSEIRYGSFRRILALPQAVDTSQVEAACAHGVLTVRLRKSPAAAARRIEVKTRP